MKPNARFTPGPERHARRLSPSSVRFNDARKRKIEILMERLSLATQSDVLNYAIDELYERQIASEPSLFSLAKPLIDHLPEIASPGDLSGRVKQRFGEIVRAKHSR